MEPGRRAACAPLARENKIELCWSKSGKLWFLNNTVDNIVVEPGELMGFNVGSWCEVTTGAVDAREITCFFFKEPET